MGDEINIGPGRYYSIGDSITFQYKKTFFGKVKEFFFGKKPPTIFTVISTSDETSIQVMPKPEGTTHG